MAQGPLRIAKLPAPRQLPLHTPPRLLIEQPPLTLANGKFVTTATLTSRTCKWPIGDPGEPGFHYCGHPPESGRPYCDAHDLRGYQPRARRRA
jgi:hypothetical protein